MVKFVFDLKAGDRVLAKSGPKRGRRGTVYQVYGHEVVDGGCVFIIWDDRSGFASTGYINELEVEPCEQS